MTWRTGVTTRYDGVSRPSSRARVDVPVRVSLSNQAAGPSSWPVHCLFSGDGGCYGPNRIFAERHLPPLDSGLTVRRHHDQTCGLSNIRHTAGQRGGPLRGATMSHTRNTLVLTLFALATACAADGPTGPSPFADKAP